MFFSLIAFKKIAFGNLFVFIYLFESSGAGCMLITDGAKLKFTALCIKLPTSMCSNWGKLV